MRTLQLQQLSDKNTIRVYEQRVQQMKEKFEGQTQFLEELLTEKQEEINSFKSVLSLVAQSYKHFALKEQNGHQNALLREMDRFQLSRNENCELLKITNSLNQQIAEKDMQFE